MTSMGSRAAPGPGIVVRRPVRAHPRPPATGELTVAPPPAVGWKAAGLAGWLQYLVPLAGSGGSVAFLFAVPGRRPGWLVALVVGAAGASVVAGLALRLVERRATHRARRRERARYLGHLDQAALQADHLAAAQLAAAEHVHPDPPRLWATVERTDRLWERRPSDADFLTVRVGRGPVPLVTPVRLDRPADPLTEHDPELLAAAQRLVGRATHLPDAPVVIPLRRLAVIALTGPPARARALARAVVCELAAFHPPDDLRFLAAWPPAADPAWRWMERLPHCAGAGPDGARAGPGGAPPHLVAIVDLLDRAGVDRPGPAGRPPPAGPGGIAADELPGRTAAAGGTVIWLAETVAGEPSELSLRVRLDDHGWATLQETTPGGRVVGGIGDGAGTHRPGAPARPARPGRAGRRRRRGAAASPLPALPGAGRRHRRWGTAGPRPQGGGRGRHRPPRPGRRGHRVGQERAAADHRGRPGRHPYAGPARLRAGRLQGRRRLRRPGPPAAGGRAHHEPAIGPVHGRPGHGRPPGRAGQTPAAPAPQRQPARPARLHRQAGARPAAGAAAPAADRGGRVRRAPGRPPGVPGPVRRHRPGRAQPRHAPAARLPAPGRGSPARSRQPPPVPGLPAHLQRRRVQRRPRGPRRRPSAPDPRGRPPQGGRRRAGRLHRRPRLDRPGGAGRRGGRRRPAGPPGLAATAGRRHRPRPAARARRPRLAAGAGGRGRPAAHTGAGAARPRPVRGRRPPRPGRRAQNRQEHAALHPGGRPRRHPPARRGPGLRRRPRRWAPAPAGRAAPRRGGLRPPRGRTGPPPGPRAPFPGPRARAALPRPGGRLDGRLARAPPGRPGPRRLR